MCLGVPLSTVSLPGCSTWKTGAMRPETTFFFPQYRDTSQVGFRSGLVKERLLLFLNNLSQTYLK